MLKNYSIEALQTLIKDFAELKKRLGEEDQDENTDDLEKFYKDGVDENELWILKFILVAKKNNTFCKF